MRPLSRIAIRSCTHSKGLPVLSCDSRNPAQPPSRGCVAKSSERVGRSGWGKRQDSGESRNPTGVRDWAPAFAGALAPDAEKAPPATRDKPLATRLTTLCSSFVLIPATRGQESMARLGTPFSDRGPPLGLSQEGLDIADDPRQCRAPQHGTDMIGVDFDRLVDLMVLAARRARRDDPVAARPEGQRWHRRLAVTARERRLIDVVASDPLIQLADVGVGLVVAGKGRAERDYRAHLVGVAVRKLTREHATEAPADDQDRPPVVNFVEPPAQQLQRIGLGAEVDAQVP